MLAVALPLRALIVLAGYDQAHDAVNNAGNSTLNVAEIAAGSTEQFLLDSQALLDHLAPRAYPYVADSRTCASFQSDFPNLPPRYTILEVIDLSGQPLCSTASPPDTNLQQVSDREWFQKVLHDNKFIVSEPLVGRITGKWSVVLAYPLDNDRRQIVGVLSMSIDLVDYQFVLDAVTLVPGSVIEIVDDAGTVIAHSPEPELFVGANVRGTEIGDRVLSQARGWTQAIGSDGVDRIYGFTATGTARWHVYAGIPADIVLADVRAELVRNSLLALVISLAVLAGAFLIGRHIALPITALAATAQAVSQGKLDARAPIEGPMEVTEVATQFNEMLDSRIQVERALRESEEKYRTVFEAAHDMIVLLDKDGNILDINQRAESLLGYSVPELRQMNTFQHLYVAEDQELMHQVIQDVTEGKSREYEARWKTEDRRIIHFAGVSAPRFSANGEFLSTICAMRDITERKQTEEALRRYTTRLEILHEIDEAILAAHSLDEIARGVLNRVISLVPCQGASVTLFDFEAQNSIVYAAQVSGSSALPSATRFPFAALGEIGQHILTLRRGEVLVIDDLKTFLPTLGVPLGEGQRAALIAPLRTQSDLIGTLNLSADRPGRFTSEAVEIIREVAASLAIAITQIRLLEEVSMGQEEMRRLASRILSAQEEERRTIAYELHDEIGQNLTALKMNLDMSSRTTSDEAQTRLEDAAKQVDELLTKVRSLSLDLRPAMLDHLGLIPTLQSYFERYTSQTNIQVRFKHTELVERFPTEIESAAYRIVQEALTNVARHAHVEEVIVRIWVDQDRLNIQIEDQGVGFETYTALSADDTSGLRGMRERAALLGGQLVVESAPAAGTKLTAELPLLNETKR